MNEELNKEQYEAIEAEEPNIIVLAPPGSGKTFTLINAVIEYRRANPGAVIDIITYTRAATQELRERLAESDIFDVNISTIHVWSREHLRNLADMYGFHMKILEQPAIMSILKTLIAGHPTKIKPEILYTYVTGNKKMDVTDSYRRTLEALNTKYINYKRNNSLYDFTDYPLYLLDKLEQYNEKIYSTDALFVDELQDVDEEQYYIFNRVEATKKFFIGDAQQCQPVGTKIYIRGQGEKNIEDVKIGDPIVFYDSAQGYCSGIGTPHNALLKKVVNIQSRDFCNEELITITSENGLQSSYTPNHRTFVRFNKIPNKHVVYLMCDDNYRFRVGKIPLFHNSNTNSGSPWRQKMINEKCEKIWLLKVCDSDKDARVEEAHISYKYGIPQTCWQLDKVLWTQDDIDYIYQDYNTKERAIQCLKDYHLDIRYPLLDASIDWSQRCHFATNASSEIYAINLLPDVMSCLVMGSPSSHRNYHAEKIINVKRTFIQDPIKVYSLEVEGGTYVADQIITHNSIYIFRGADMEIFNKLQDFEYKTLKVNYRSYQEILDYARTFYIALEPKLGRVNNLLVSNISYTKPGDVMCIRGKGGYVWVLDPFGNTTLIGTGTVDTYTMGINFLNRKPMILCRTNKQVKMIEELG